MASKKGVENFKRRTWDQAEYERLALDREDRERAGKKPTDTAEEDFAVDTDFGKFHYADAGAAGPTGSSKAYLDVEKARGNLDLDAKVGKVEKIVGGARQAGYHCSVCDRTFQDSLALLDHLNGREHQSRLGFSSYIAPSSKEQVKSRLSAHIGKAATAIASKSAKKTSESDSLEARVKAAEREMEAQKAEKESKKKKKQKVSSEAADDVESDNQADPEMMAALGFASFGGT